MAPVSRSDQVAAFYASHAPRLQRVLSRQLRDAEAAADGCARAWEILLTHPEVDLDHRGAKWLEVTALREARRELKRTAGPERLDAELPDGATVGERLVGREDRVDERLEAERRLGLLAALPPDQRRAVMLKACGFSDQEIAEQTATTDCMTSNAPRRVPNPKLPPSEGASGSHGSKGSSFARGRARRPRRRRSPGSAVLTRQARAGAPRGWASMPRSLGDARHRGAQRDLVQALLGRAGAVLDRAELSREGVGLSVARVPLGAWGCRSPRRRLDRRHHERGDDAALT